MRQRDNLANYPFILSVWIRSEAQDGVIVLSGLGSLAEWTCCLQTRTFVPLRRDFWLLSLAASLSTRCSRAATVSSYEMIFPPPTTMRFRDSRFLFSQCHGSTSVQIRLPLAHLKECQAPVQSVEIDQSRQTLGVKISRKKTSFLSSDDEFGLHCSACGDTASSQFN